MTNLCPACGQPIAVGDINITEGVALCRACGKLSRLADIVGQPAVDANTLATPPGGCSYDEMIDGTQRARASQRSLGTATGLLAICLFWNGIISIFVLVAIGGIYTHFFGPLPQWFPAPGSRGNHRKSDMSLSQLLFLCIFLIPFVVFGLGMFFGLVGSLIGRIEVLVTGDDGRVRFVCGPLFWTRRFDVSKVTRVAIDQARYQQNAQNKPLIQIDADKTIRFGTMLPDFRRTWMLGVCQMLLRGQGKATGTRKGPRLSAMMRG